MVGSLQTGAKYFKKHPPTPVGTGGFVLPEEFTVVGVVNDSIRVEIDILVKDGRAHAKQIRVETDSPRGITSTTLRQIPVLDIVAGGARHALSKMHWDADSGTVSLVRIKPGTKLESQAVAALRSAVQYVEIEP